MTEIEKNIIKLYSEDKLSSLKIARQLGVSPSKVLTTLSKFGVPKRDFNEYHFISDNIRSDVISRYNGYQAIETISENLQISRHKVRRILVEAGIKIKESKDWGTPLTEEDEKEIIRLYFEENVKSQVLVRRYKMCNERFPRILKKHGFNVKPRNAYRIVILTEEQEKEIVEKIKSGILVSHLLKCLSFKCSERIMRRCIRKHFPNFGRDVNKNWETRYSPEILEKLKEKRSKRISVMQTGKTGSAYGKPPTKSWSRGYFGYYKEKFHFRSLLELSYIIHLEENKISWQSGEDQDWLIEYKDEYNGDRTYWPDFLLNGNKIVEIKPSQLHNHPDIARKNEAAIKFCNERGWNFEILDPKTNYRKIKQEYLAGFIVFGADWDKKFNKRFFKKKLL